MTTRPPRPFWGTPAEPPARAGPVILDNAGLERLDTFASGGLDELVIRSLDPADPPFPVEVSPALARHRDEVAARLRSSLDQ
ncbi:MAG TPA: hypothetical protein VE173_01165 [Longimicrobiales bacterium]|nr:hypothetical protein [Longimicrobiales bacterium]